MKTKTYYVCEICGEEYQDPEGAEACEAHPAERPIYKVGDVLTITGGECAGSKGKVTRVFHYKPSWHPSYAHRVGYSADVIGSWGSRQLIQGVDCK